MGALSRIFEPIAENVEVSLDMIQVVAFDTNGTLIHTSSKKHVPEYVADSETVQLLGDLIANKEMLGLEEIVIISGSAKHAKDGLRLAGLEELADGPVENRDDFYLRMGRERKNVLAVDDEFLLALDAKAYINPRAKRVRDYLKDKSYQSVFNI